MYDYLLSVFLGIVEGLTEFLPVSSTAHLRICEALLHIDLHDGFWKMYTIVIQLGAILALPVYFWGRIMRFCSHVSEGRTRQSHHLHASAEPHAHRICGDRRSRVGSRKVIGKNLESLWVMAMALLIGGIVMWIVDAVFTSATHDAHGGNDAAAGGLDRLPRKFSPLFSPARRAQCPRLLPDKSPACRVRPHLNFLFFFRCRQWRSLWDTIF
jgi:undecaprenyl pyrophosphate phosphatase UppP